MKSKNRINPINSSRRRKWRRKTKWICNRLHCKMQAFFSSLWRNFVRAKKNMNIEKRSSRTGLAVFAGARAWKKHWWMSLLHTAISTILRFVSFRFFSCCMPLVLLFVKSKWNLRYERANWKLETSSLLLLHFDCMWTVWFGQGVSEYICNTVADGIN